MHRAGEFGLRADNLGFDLAAVVKRSRGVAKQLNSGVGHLLKKHKVAVVMGAARLTAPGRIAVTGDKGGEEIAAKAVIVATGARARELPGLEADGKRVWTPSWYRCALLARGRSHLDLSPEALRQILGRAATDPEVFEALPLEEVRTLQIYPFMAASWIGALLGLIALALSVSGLFGVLTYTLTQRSKEIGIRIALGATAGTVVRMVMRQTAWLAGAGAMVGLAGAFVLLQILGATVRMRALSLVDGAAFGAGLAMVVAAAAIAAYQPARRAARVDPARRCAPTPEALPAEG